LNGGRDREIKTKREEDKQRCTERKRLKGWRKAEIEQK
jgi:hypothetical protein